MFASNTRIRPVPTIIGLFFALVTGRALFDDVLASPLPLIQAVTVTHALTLAGMVAAIAAGHYALDGLRLLDLRTWKLGARATLGVIFLSATAYIVVASGSRSAEQAAIKVVNATDIAEKRAEARKRLDAAEAAHVKAVNYWTEKRDAADTECSPQKGGEGTKCRGARATAADALTATEKARRDADRLRTAYDDLKPAPPANAGYAHFAKIVTAFFGGNNEAITAQVALAMPFVIVLITELATIVFLHMGLAGHVSPVTALSIPDLDKTSPADLEEARKLLVPPTNGGPGGPNGGQTATVIQLHPVLKALKDAGRPLSNDELAHAMGVTKGEASKRRREVAHLVTEWKDGRHVRVAVG